MRFAYTLLLLLMFVNIAKAQVTGTVKNDETGLALENIPVSIINTASNSSHTSYTDSLGCFSLNVNDYGEYSILISVLGYETLRYDNLFFAPKQVQNMEISLSPKSYLIGELVKSAWGVDKTNGVSSYEINPSFMNLTVGSSYDIMRSATLIPGVSNTSDASNDLNIRGNSPWGTAWYIEDVPVVSPNHFTDNNSANGVFSIFDSWGVNKMELYTSAFPIEYGNAISGVLNTELRTGNMQKFKGNINVSTLSAGAILEGPIQKDKSSVIGGFRYTFPNAIHKIFPSYSEKLGTTPDVFDGFFKLHSSLSRNLKLNLWGIGGDSDAIFKYTTDDLELVSLQRSGKSISSGLSLDYYGNSIAVKTNLYTSHRSNYEYVVSKHAMDSKAGWYGVNTKLYMSNVHSKLMVGLDAKRRYYNQYREISTYYKDSINTTYANDFSAFASYTYLFEHDFSIKAGLHYLYNGIAEKHRLEPRVEIRKQFHSSDNLYLGYREQSTNTPIVYSYTYEPTPDGDVMRNKVALPLMKSRHFVLGWDRKYKSNIRITSEVFYQHLYDVTTKVLSGGYTEDPYASGGITLGVSGIPPSTIGRNYGLELSIDAPWADKGIYLYTAGTIYNSEYKDRDGVWTPTLFNSSFSLTTAIRKDFNLSSKTRLSLSLNYIEQGGRRYTPVDEEKTQENMKLTYDLDQINACKYPNYSRVDASISFALLGRKLSHSFAVEAQNIFNRENILERYEYYNHDPVVINQVMRVFVYKYSLSF